MNNAMRQQRLLPSLHGNARPGFIVGTAFLCLLICLMVFIPEPTASQLLVMRSVLALGGAGYSVLLTGSLNLQITHKRKVSVMAAGAFAVFVLLYVVTPTLRLHDGAASVNQAKVLEHINTVPRVHYQPSVSLSVSGTGNFMSNGNSGTINYNVTK